MSAEKLKSAQGTQQTIRFIALTGIDGPTILNAAFVLAVLPIPNKHPALQATTAEKSDMQSEVHLANQLKYQVREPTSLIVGMLQRDGFMTVLGR